MELEENKKREFRVINRDFSLGEYGQSWTKLERYLFIEIYNVIKDFYLSASDENIKTFSSESILLTLPVNRLDKSLFKASQKNRDLMKAAEGLSKKQINLKSLDEEGQWSFRFISMFPEICYEPSKDKNKILIRIPNSIYEQMVPIESYCQLDLKLLSEFGSGNTIRLYEIFKSYAFKKNFNMEFNELRKQLGFFNEGNYEEWKHFNAKVLKPAVKDINSHKQYDIEVFYEKKRGLDKVSFTIKTHRRQDVNKIQVLNLNEEINELSRTPNLIQKKYIETVVSFCKQKAQITNEIELTDWIITDLINQQQDTPLDFKRCMNEISKQLRMGIYSEPYSHKYLAPTKYEFDPVIYEEMKKMEREGADIQAKFNVEQIKANHFGHLLS